MVSCGRGSTTTVRKHRKQQLACDNTQGKRRPDGWASSFIAVYHEEMMLKVVGRSVFFLFLTIQFFYV